MAQIDTNLRVRRATQLVQENAQYDGQFRLLRHCDVSKGELFLEEASDGGTLAVRYHRADVDGRILAVRYYVYHHEESSAGTDAARDVEGFVERITSHDRLLAEISSIQKSHKNVVRLYGWNTNSTREQFVVLKSGFKSAWMADEGPKCIANSLKLMVR
ncbi:hypothetical protein AURDEDRAFT_117431 [Auricularia subglabra TFB-10046 SS5]|uniref:Uncharacterized protein n=1 Tax=Auricularia subglabra (strain TFB-10046 / SS5) TaxID=717982 RepID=J0CX35_AURST|nr:hypothetical protein AURDEDRAFT_117431 [Auricularia subglabra TFB-10046 SS5]